MKVHADEKISFISFPLRKQKRKGILFLDTRKNLGPLKRKSLLH
jgi:hypothetical protein